MNRLGWAVFLVGAVVWGRMVLQAAQESTAGYP